MVKQYLIRLVRKKDIINEIEKEYGHGGDLNKYTKEKLVNLWQNLIKLKR